jgi:hypothetical protein
MSTADELINMNIALRMNVNWHGEVKVRINNRLHCHLAIQKFHTEDPWIETGPLP